MATMMFMWGRNVAAKTIREASGRTTPTAFGQGRRAAITNVPPLDAIDPTAVNGRAAADRAVPIAKLAATLEGPTRVGRPVSWWKNTFGIGITRLSALCDQPKRS